MKPFLIFRAPVQTQSGYGAHSRDILFALYMMDMFDIKIDSCRWGDTPMTALNPDNVFHSWILENCLTGSTKKPDIYIQVTVPNEFQKLGNFSIGITAGIETTVAPRDWVDGCNRMDLIIVPSTFSKEVLLSTSYTETIGDKVIKQDKVKTPIEVLFEGVDVLTYNNEYKGIDLDIKEDFCFLQVGHWLRGDLGHDRKNIGMLIKCFAETFKNELNKPGLIVKTSTATFSIKERERIRRKIEDIVRGVENPPSIYLLFGELTDFEMNELYNHPKVKSMITLTRGEGFGRPLLEFSMTGKPIIASNWSGHKDFLPMNNAAMIGGTIEQVHGSSVDQFIIKEAHWFTPNYSEASEVMKIMIKEYNNFLERSEELRIQNKENFSLGKMSNKFKNILEPFIVTPEEYKLTLPAL
jgi:glycosyltransferase involved in cell wall biosynthesis